MFIDHVIYLSEGLNFIYLFVHLLSYFHVNV